MGAEVRFRAMGCDAHVVVVGGDPSLLDAARERIEVLESRWSRFRPSSEIGVLNARAGRPVVVSEETLTLVRLALEGARRTGGRYDPTVLGAVVRAGYDRSLEDGSSAPLDPDLGQGWERILVDSSTSTVTIPRGVGFDTGGIGKGLAADLVAEELLALGAEGVCVNLGGDLRVEGSGPDGGGWIVAVEGPSSPEQVATIALSSGGVATSSRTRRTFGDGRHHLIDPASGLPARSGLSCATAISARSWQAEVAAKAAFIGGWPNGLALARGLGAETLLVTDEGEIRTSPGFARFAGSEPRVAVAVA
jgi:thiamine biosynthesis lipoprotein